ncbi:MAG: hypothetical protein SWH61_08220 [Thermodesulfobacteriota bacterium]|nr:hypothetical protein [Thermodesulfobacteriota bacterium]
MDLDKLNITVRPRPPFEGIDLGFAIAARWFLPLWILWTGTALPVFLVIQGVCFSHPLLALLLIWWLKPLFETPLLFWLSRRIFNEAPGPGRIFRSIIPTVRPQLPARLLWRRLTPARSFYMPVIFLEAMRGKNYGQRTGILGDNQTAGQILTMICLLFELLVLITMLLLVDIMLPQSLVPVHAWDILFSGEGAMALVRNTLILFSMSLIAPFYIAAGFSLYLTRRTILEAWDIELNFKRLMARKKNDAPLLALFLACCLLLTAMGMTPSVATAMDKADAKDRIEQILKSDDFGSEKTVTYWRLKSFNREPAPKNDFWIDFLKDLVRFLAMVVKPLLWAAGGILLITFIYIGAKYLGFSVKSGPRAATVPPQSLFGLPLTPESLPSDIPGTARNYLADGDVRTALSLLYRGALYNLVHRHFLNIPESATEGECMSLVQKNREETEAGFFREMTGTWLKMAYGHIQPELQTVRGLCDQWQLFYA